MTDAGRWRALRGPQGIRLGLIGFVFSGRAEGNIGVNLCGIRGCGDSFVLGIGFVLRKKSDL